MSEHKWNLCLDKLFSPWFAPTSSILKVQEALSPNSQKLIMEKRVDIEQKTGGWWRRLLILNHWQNVCECECLFIFLAWNSELESGLLRALWKRMRLCSYLSFGSLFYKSSATSWMVIRYDLISASKPNQIHCRKSTTWRPAWFLN